jgi:hypothetical protein
LVYKKEAVAVAAGFEKFHSYLKHREFTLMRDNLALSWLLCFSKNWGGLDVAVVIGHI